MVQIETATKNRCKPSKTACNGINGVPGGSRTLGPMLRRHVLYPTELLRHKNKSFCERLLRAESQHATYLSYCIGAKKSIANAAKNQLKKVKR